MPFLRPNWSESYFDWLYTHKKAIHLVFLIVTVISLFFAVKLKLKTDFATLLPDKLESVKNLRRATDRIGGTGALLIGVESPSFSANKKFMDELNERLKALTGKSLRYVEYKYHESRDYLHRFGLHYLSNEQLEKLSNYLETRIQKEKDKSVGSFLGLGDEEENKAPENKSTHLEGLDPQLQNLLKYPDAYLGSPDGKILVMFARPLSSSLGVAKNREILSEIKAIVASMKPEQYHPQMYVGYGGNVVSSIDEVETVRADLFDTVLVLIVLILLILFLFLWSWRLIFLICAALLIAVAWTFGLTQIFIGYLNTQTAFLGSLVVGTGINYGIIFVSRYLENRKLGLEIRRATVNALRDTLIATLIASSSTAISFVSLFLAENKGLSQFGFIGSIGVALTWFASYTLLPIWLYALESKRPTKLKTKNPLAQKSQLLLSKAGKFCVTHYRAVLGATVLVTLISIGGIVRLMKNPLEQDFDKLRNRITKKAGVAAFEKKMQSTLPTSRTPAPLLLETDAEAQEACKQVEAIAKAQDPEKQMIHMCMSLYKMLPQNFEWSKHREQLFRKIQAILSNPLLKYSEHAEVLTPIKDKLSYTPPGVEDLPEEIKVKFREKDGSVGKIAFVSPRPDKTLSNAVHLFNFVDPLSKIELPSSGRVISATGDSFVLADLFRSVTRDGLVVGISAFVAVIVVAMFLAGGLKAGLLMSGCLLIGTLWMLGIQGFFDINFNFFNFIALPLTFGIGLDYPVNVFIRCRQENYKNYPKILVGSGTAVILCSLTTTIGYITLLEATNQALISFAQLSVIGEITCMLTAIFVLPALLRALGKFKQESN